MSTDECGNGGKLPDTIPPEIWWKISHYGCEIVPVQVVAHTKCFVTIRPWKDSWQKEDRRTSINGEYFPTYSFARSAKLEQLHNNTVRLRTAADQESAKYAELFKREEPTVPQE